MDPITGFIINLIIGLVLSAASTLIKSMLDQDKKQVAGVRGTLQKGGDNPLSFIMGFYGTAGHLKYAGAWGTSGETPNAYLSKVITVSDLPIRSYAGWFVNGERVTLAATMTGDLGYAVLQYRVAGKDHMWIKPYLGDQTTADPLMRAKFGGDADRPYTDTMIGRGQAYFVATALQNRELFANLPEYFAEVNGISLDDPRGDNAHDNPIVGIYTLLQGIYYGGAWVYGPQSITTNRLPSANWQAQMDKCDAIVAGAKRFRFGLEVSVDQEPHAIIGELLKACEGRIAEIGGSYKVLVGEPDAPVVSITDEDIVITEGQSYEPFPGLESTFNGVTATYPEPQEAWESKEAPPRYRSDLELLDDNRRLPFSTDYKAVPFPVQVQRLMRAAIEETRRFRRHTKTMPPEWWEYEPLDAYAWTSDRNGYEDKLFLITAMDDLPNGNQFVGDQEIDPADYDWSSDYELPWDVAPLVISRPLPQITTGFSAAPYTVVDEDSNARRPAIEVFWDGGLVDVRATRIQVRENWGAKLLIADVSIDYDIEDTAPSKVVSNPAILPNATYEVRGVYVPFSGRITRWSNQDIDGTEGAWLSVTTPDVKLGPLDVVYGDLDLDALGVQFNGLLEWMGGNVRDLIEQAQAQAVLTGDQELANAMQFDEMRRSLSTVAGDLSASFEETITTAIVPMNGQLVAIADALTELTAADGDAVNTARWRMTATTGPGGSSQLGFETRFDTGDPGDFRTAGMFILTPNNPATPTSMLFDAQRFVFGDLSSGSIVNPLVYDTGVWRVNDLLVGSASIQDLAVGSAKIGNLAVTTAKIDALAVTNAKIGLLAVDSAQIASAAITNAKIDNLAVDTIKIADAAVTSLYQDVNTAHTVTTPVGALIGSINVAVTDYPVTVGGFIKATMGAGADKVFGITITCTPPAGGGSEYTVASFSKTFVGSTVQTISCGTSLLPGPAGTYVFKSYVNYTLEGGAGAGSLSVVDTISAGVPKK